MRSRGRKNVHASRSGRFGQSDKRASVTMALDKSKKAAQPAIEAISTASTFSKEVPQRCLIKLEVTEPRWPWLGRPRKSGEPYGMDLFAGDSRACHSRSGRQLSD